MWTLWLVYIVTKHSHSYLSIGTIQVVNHPVRKFELVIRGFGHCRYLYKGKGCSLSKFFCCSDQLPFQSHQSVEIWLSDCKTLCYSKLFNLRCHPSWKIWVLHPSNWSRCRTKKIVQISHENFQSQHSRYRLSCPWKQSCFKTWDSVVDIVQWLLKEVICFLRLKGKKIFWSCELSLEYAWSFVSFCSMWCDVSIKGDFLFWSMKQLISIFWSSFLLGKRAQKSLTLFLGFVCSGNASTIRWQL